MKKLIMIAVILFSSVWLGCEKPEESFCWDCVTTISGSGIPTSTMNNVVCDKTDAQINDYTKQMTYTTTIGSKKTYTKTKCSKQ